MNKITEEVAFHIAGQRVYAPSLINRIMLAKGGQPMERGLIVLKRGEKYLHFSHSVRCLPPIPPVFRRCSLYSPVDGGLYLHNGDFQEETRINYHVVQGGEFAWGVRLFAAFTELRYLEQKGYNMVFDIATPEISVQEMSDFLWTILPDIAKYGKERLSITFLYTGKILVSRGMDEVDEVEVRPSDSVVGEVHNGAIPPHSPTDNKVGALVYRRPTGEWVTNYGGLRPVSVEEGAKAGWYTLGMGVSGEIHAIAPLVPFPIPRMIRETGYIKYIVYNNNKFISAADLEIYELTLQKIEEAERK